jgi:hypothetical protein
MTGRPPLPHGLESPANRRERNAVPAAALLGTLVLSLMIAVSPALVVPAAADASYQQDPGPDGLVWIDAADLSSTRPGSGLAWRVSADPPGKGRVVLAPHDSAGAEEPADLPRLRYRVIFTKSGPHFLWVHGHGPGGPSIDAGLDDVRIPGGTGIRLPSRSPGWSDRNERGTRASFTVPTPGEYDLHIWGRDDGTSLDRIIVTSNRKWDPSVDETRGRPRLTAFYTRVDSGEAWEAHERVGPHADVVLELEELGGTFAFWRGSSYRPYWETREGRWFLDEVIPRTGDGTGLRPDRTNLYARADIIESTSARAVVRWRYVPDFSNPGFDGWAEEYFTVYPDGLCVRSIRRGTPTLREWVDPAHTEVRSFRLTTQGISSVAAPGPAMAALMLSRASGGSYADEGDDRTRGSHVLRCREPGRPTPLSFTLEARDGHPIRNPVIVVRDWGDASATVSIDHQASSHHEAGSVGHLNGADLVLWLDLESRSRVDVLVEPVGGSEPIARAPVPDPYRYEIPVLPEGSADPGPFGAYYTHLKYFEEWDEPWRVGPHADVVVQFEDHPHRFVFWRGADYVPHWANDANHWYENEFVERRAGDAGLEGCCAEPMQDHEARYSNARIIASHDARAVVHWRYAPSDRNYDVAYVDETGWGDRVDEYYYVYPDAVAVREATLYTSAPHKFNEWHEAIPLVNPGKIPEDVLEMEAIALTNTREETRVYSWQDGFPKTLDDDRNIMLIGLRGSTRPFVVVESRGVWVDEISLPDESRFNHYDDWPGWPASMRRRDWERNPETGYREFWKILPSHSSLMHFMWDDYAQDLEGPVKWKTKIMLNGLTPETDAGALIPLARSWETPPVLRLRGSGYAGGGYDKAQRAYRVEKISADPRALEATLEASPEAPLVNVCLVIEGWPGGTTARLRMDGQPVPSGEAFRQGIERTPDGGTALVVWIETQSTSPVTLAISPR